MIGDLKKLSRKIEDHCSFGNHRDEGVTFQFVHDKLIVVVQVHDALDAAMTERMLSRSKLPLNRIERCNGTSGFYFGIRAEIVDEVEKQSGVGGSSVASISSRSFKPVDGSDNEISDHPRHSRAGT